MEVKRVLVALFLASLQETRCWENVALLSRGATCRASTHFQHRQCRNAINGKLIGGMGWAAVNEGVGSWIKINFDRTYVLTYGRLMQRTYHGEQSREVTLTYGEDLFITEMLAKRIGTTWNDYRGQHWDEFPLDNIETSYVKIEVTSAYTELNNGFLATEFYTGRNPCLMQYTFVQGSCYRYDIIRQITWQDAREVCADEGADLVGLETASEMQAITEWLGDSFDIVVNLWVYAVHSPNGRWHWQNPNDTWFDWASTEQNVSFDRAALDTGLNKIIVWSGQAGFICEADGRPGEGSAAAALTGDGYGSNDDIMPAALTSRDGQTSISVYVVVIALLVTMNVAMVTVFLIWRYRATKRAEKKKIRTAGSQDTLDSYISHI